jgi:hypothetical protein
VKPSGSVRCLPGATAATLLVVTLTGVEGWRRRAETTRPVVDRPPEPNAVECLTLASEALTLRDEFRRASASSTVSDPTPYKARAEALRGEYGRLACPGEILKDFPGG